MLCLLIETKYQSHVRVRVWIYRRVYSYFRHKWLANPCEEPLMGWKDLPEFVRKLAAHRPLNRSLPPLHEVGPLPHIVISRHPARHPLVCRRSRGNAIEARPENGLGICLVTYLLSEALTGFMPMPLRMCVLRLEVLHMDLIHLHAVLCRWFRFCERLPAIPEIIPTGLRS